MAESRYLQFVKRLGAFFDAVLLVVAVGGLVASGVAAFEGRWIDALIGGILSSTLLLLWWLWRQAP